LAGSDGAGGVKTLEVATSGGEAAQMVKAFAEKLQKGGEDSDHPEGSGY